MHQVLCPICINQVLLEQYTPDSQIICPYCQASFCPEKGFGLEKVHQSVNSCCHGESQCGSCQKSNCLVGYAKLAVSQSVDQGYSKIPEGERLVPKNDVKDFDPYDLKVSLVEILISCQSCKDQHHSDCIVNIVRNCIETALLGESLEYKGSPEIYLMDLETLNPQIGIEIGKEYYRHE